MGAPFEKGSTFYAEQNMMSEKVKYKGTITDCILGRKITMKFSFPLSLITEKIEMIVEDHDSYSKFLHITYMKFKFLSRTIFKKQNLRMLNDMDTHARTEGGNMKNILKKGYYGTSISDIQKQLDIGRTTLYHHCANIDDSEAFNRVREGFIEKLEKIKAVKNN